MQMRWMLVCFLFMTVPALAEDGSPWFGSQASMAEQIILQKHAQSMPKVSQQTTFECPVEGCPVPARTAK